MFGIGPQELNVAIEVIKRAPIEGGEAKAVAVTLDKLEKALQLLTQPQVSAIQTDEDENGNDAEPAE